MEIYLDNNATTPLDPRVATAMRPWFEERHGNPSSSHAAGRAARAAVEAAREEVAALLGGRPEDVVFTASGSEANSQVLETVAADAGEEGGTLVVSILEHPSVKAAARRAARRSRLEVVEVRPTPDGRVDPDTVAAVLGERTRLVALMAANNELGTVQPVAEVVARCREHDVPVLCDAVQAVGKIPVDVGILGADWVVIGGHKFHGPLGAAAVWVRPGRKLEPLVVGAPQERGRRAGTENVPAIVGLGEAARLAREELAVRSRDLARLRDRFETGLADVLPDAIVHCAEAPRVPHVSHVAFPGVLGLRLSERLDARGVCVSIGAACSSGKPEPSPVVLATGVTPDEALASLRISFGILNTPEEVDRVLPILAEEVRAARAERSGAA